MAIKYVYEELKVHAHACTLLYCFPTIIDLISFPFLQMSDDVQETAIIADLSKTLEIQMAAKLIIMLTVSFMPSRYFYEVLYTMVCNTFL